MTRETLRQWDEAARTKAKLAKRYRRNRAIGLDTSSRVKARSRSPKRWEWYWKKVEKDEVIKPAQTDQRPDLWLSGPRPDDGFEPI